MDSRTYFVKWFKCLTTEQTQRTWKRGEQLMTRQERQTGRARGWGVDRALCNHWLWRRQRASTDYSAVYSEQVDRKNNALLLWKFWNKASFCFGERRQITPSTRKVKWRGSVSIYLFEQQWQWVGLGTIKGASLLLIKKLRYNWYL